MGLGEIFGNRQRQQVLAEEAVRQFRENGPDGNSQFWNAYNQLSGDEKEKAHDLMLPIAVRRGDGEWMEQLTDGKPHSAKIGHRAEVVRAVGQRSRGRRRRELKTKAALWMKAARELHQKGM